MNWTYRSLPYIPPLTITSLNDYNNLNSVSTFILFHLTWCCNVGTTHAAILLKCIENVVEIELQSSVVCWNYLFALLQYRTCSTAAWHSWRKPSICATTGWSKSLYDFVQDGAPGPNVHAVVHKHPQQAPVESDQSNEYQVLDEMPTSSAADFTQHYAVINNHTNKRNALAYDKLNRKI